MRIFQNFAHHFESFRTTPYSPNQCTENGRIVYRHGESLPPENSLSSMFKDQPDPGSIIMGHPFLCPLGENYDRLGFGGFQLEDEDLGDDRIMILTSGYMPLNHLVTHKSEAAIIFDINPIQIIFWEMTLDYIRACEIADLFFETMKEQGQKEFEDRVKKWMGQNYADHLTKFSICGLTIREEIEHLFSNLQGASWDRNSSIARQENYDYLHLMVKHNAIAIITLDAYDVQALTHLNNTLRNSIFEITYIKDKLIINSIEQSGTSISFQYLSNIFEGRLEFYPISNEPVTLKDDETHIELWDKRKLPRQSLIAAGQAWNSLFREEGGIRVSGFNPSLRYVDGPVKTLQALGNNAESNPSLKPPVRI